MLTFRVFFAHNNNLPTYWCCLSALPFCGQPVETRIFPTIPGTYRGFTIVFSTWPWGIICLEITNFHPLNPAPFIHLIFGFLKQNSLFGVGLSVKCPRITRAANLRSLFHASEQKNYFEEYFLKEKFNFPKLNKIHSFFLVCRCICCSSFLVPALFLPGCRRKFSKSRARCCPLSVVHPSYHWISYLSDCANEICHSADSLHTRFF